MLSCLQEFCQVVRTRDIKVIFQVNSKRKCYFTKTILTPSTRPEISFSLISYHPENSLTCPGHSCTHCSRGVSVYATSASLATFFKLISITSSTWINHFSTIPYSGAGKFNEEEDIYQNLMDHNCYCGG